MERQLKQTRKSDVDSPGTSSGDRRQHPSPPVKSPEDSPPRSSMSSLSSLSHGFSPERDQVENLEESQGPPGSPPLDPLPNLSHPKPPSQLPPPVPVVNRYVRDEPVPMTMADRGAQDGYVGRPPEKPRAGGASGVDGERRSRPSGGGVSTMEKEAAVKKAALGFRIFELLFCLISLSVMAADKDQGWALDSFYRYKEFRYCMAVNVIGFAYATLQGSDLAYQLATKGYHNRRHPIRYYFDFAVDQILTYLLISAGSSAATRVDDWKANWGPDKFPEMATASVGLALVAFLAFAFSSLISGYLLYTSKSV